MCVDGMPIMQKGTRIVQKGSDTGLAEVAEQSGLRRPQTGRVGVVSSLPPPFPKPEWRETVHRETRGAGAGSLDQASFRMCYPLVSSQWEGQLEASALGGDPEKDGQDPEKRHTH